MSSLLRAVLTIILLCTLAFGQGAIVTTPSVLRSPLIVSPGVAAAGNTFSAVHVPQTLSTACTTTNSCAFTVTSTGSGNLEVFTITNTSGGADYATSITGLGTGVCPASAQLHNASIGAVSLCYVLSTNSGQTTATIGFGATSNYVISYSESSYTPGPISLDNCGTNSNTSSSTSNTGATATITGTSDIAFQWIVLNTGDPSAITTYQNIVFGSGLRSGAADLLNTSSNTAPTWTTTNAESVTGGCWFK